MASLSSTSIPTPTDASAQSSTTASTGAGATATSSTQSQQRKRRPKKKKPHPAITSEATATNSTAAASTLIDAPKVKAPPTTAPSKNQIRNAKRKDQQRKKKEQEHRDRQKHAWWRSQLPSDSVDPITLESLQSLQYPPFALVASPPYIPIDYPPINNSKDDTCSDRDEQHKGLTEEERQRQILEAQWGKSLIINNADKDDVKPSSETENCNRQHRHVNLFDGRALAYYMVSQLQFIDPLNRRDIARDELIHLDHYLRRHNFYELNVVEAYDTKGVTLSSAGATANTALGRSIILQQEAQALLNALFGGNTVSRTLPAATSNHLNNNNNNNDNTRNTLMAQYEAHEATHRRHHESSSTSRPRSHQAHASNTEHRINILDDSGMVIIDDDETPGLRGNASAFPLYSANHITARHGGGNGRPVQEYEFPSLSATVQPSNRTTQGQPTAPAASVPKTLPKAKTLSKISKMIKQTDPEEQQRQWEAREQARRKAMLANLTFGSNPTIPLTSEVQQLLSDGIPTQISTVTGPSIAQIERNRAFADALGVQPATLRSNTIGGWMRPTERTLEYDDFGNELNFTTYPGSLIQKAKDMRSDFLYKLEKKWKLFLNDDRAASLPLYPMNRSNRAFVHEYAEYWKLHTESFDPEPKRYVHCVKLRDTSAPYPLLSDAMKQWPLTEKEINDMLDDALAFSEEWSVDHSINQTAGQSTTSSEHRQQSREFPSDLQHQRVPLSLKPRSSVPQNSTSTLSGSTSIGGVPSRNATLVINGSDNRFVALADGRERPKLALQKRTLPLELPPYNNNNAAVAVDLNVVHLQQMERHQQKVQKKQEKEQRKMRALQSAFASDDEKSDSDSEWEEKVAVYHSGSDEE